MSFHIVFRHAARTEFDLAAEWYEERRAGLGPLFTSAVQHVLDRISMQPDFYPEVFQDAREALVPGFPYCVYYRVETTRIKILSVFHTARDPIIWQRRV